MVDISPQSPKHIEGASFVIDDEGLMTLAAFLLASAIWFYKREFGEDSPIPPEEDARPLGLDDWHLGDAEARMLPLDGELRELGDERYGFSDPPHFHADLGKLVYTAYRSRRSADLARAVMKGTSSPDALIRICALTSAFQMFKFDEAEKMRRLMDFDFSESETTETLRSMLIARVLRMAVNAVNAAPPVAPSVQASPGVTLIHGTNFPPNRPMWSVPKTGPLFKHIAAFRTDIYAQPDYFRWEGGYSDYAREVAAYNLDDWIQRRSLSGIDAVAHSHGGNVLMAATNRGLNFNRVVFLSCPVRWHQYSPRAGSIQKAQSVRIKFDFVILADGSKQRFPRNSGIPEHVLPVWFVSHSAATLPATWQSQGLDQYIK